MAMNEHREGDRRLGLDRSITRRDFLQGMAVAIGSPRLRQDPGEDAPGIAGQDVASTERGHRIRDGSFARTEIQPHDAGESYDLVVVGSGIAGLAAAYVYRAERGGRGRVLILENNDDFGGHARRNTFQRGGARFVVNGGTYDLESPEDSPQAALEILKGLGIDFDRLQGYRDPRFRERYGLSPSVFFDPRVYPGIRPIWVSGFHQIPYSDFFAKAPLADGKRRELIELYTTRRNYLPGVEDPWSALRAWSWESFLREKMGLGDEAVRFSNLYATDLVGLGCDAIAASHGFEVGPGFFGMGGEGFYDQGGVLRYAYQPMYRYPDGNHSIARHLLKKLLPDALSGPDTMEGVFQAEVRRDRFDRRQDDVRLRLRSTVSRVQHDGRAGVAIDYAEPDGSQKRVRARGAIVTAWGMVAKHIVPELDSAQTRALEQYLYCSQLYINVLLRHWRPIAEIGAFEMYLPGGYCTWMHPLDPLRIGDYAPDYHPDRPTVLSMFRYLHEPGLPAEEQVKLGRYELERKSFSELEREIRTELQHVLGPWGFEARSEILAITVNRWGHGYVLTPFPREGGAPFVQGRRAVGRISFAGADAGGTPWTQAALQQAARAAREQIEIGGQPA